MPESPRGVGRLSRRGFLLASLGVAGAACSRSPVLIEPNGPTVQAAERRRTKPGGSTVQADLRPRPITADLAGRTVSTWAFSDQIGGPGLRATAGDLMDITVHNELPDPTSIHWHGIALRNDMDGVHDLTQSAIAPGGTFNYRFTVPDPGTYWFHPHTGLQLDRGLYSPFIIDDRFEPGRYDAEAIVVLDDWLDGMGGRTPEKVFAKLKPADGAPADMSGMARSDLLGGDAGDVRYALHLINGRPPADRPTFEVPSGGRMRLRVINAGSDTAYRFAVAGHSMTVTHTDGFPVVPVEVDAILIGMGERYDVTVDVRSGVWPFVALAEGKDDTAEAVIRTTGSVQTAPQPGTRPAEFNGRLLTYDDLKAAPGVATPGLPNRTLLFDLAGSMDRYDWKLQRQPATAKQNIVRAGDRVALAFTNTGSMFHPMHLHGHTFRLGNRPEGPRKDTAIVKPRDTVTMFFHADNPGRWMLHCHNTYHLEAGMSATIAYAQ